MERRDFLRLGAAGVAGATSSCVGAPPGKLAVEAPARPTPDMAEFLRKLDRDMEAIRVGQPFGKYQPGALMHGRTRSRRRRKELERRDILARKSLRSIYLAGAIQELPDEARRHAGLQDRLRRYAPEADEAVFGTKQMLASLSPREREQLRVALRRDRHLPMRVAETLDVKGERSGVPKTPRRKLRTIMTDVSWRLRNQPPSALIDEVVDKVERVGERHGYSEELQRKIATRAAEATFWGLSEGTAIPWAGMQAGSAESDSEGWTPVKSDSQSDAPAKRDADGWTPVHSEPEPAPKHKEHPGSGTVSAGLWMLGIGAGVFFLAAAANGGQLTAWVFVATAGVVLLLIGIITLIVGGIIYAASSDPNDEKTPEEPPPDEGWQYSEKPAGDAPNARASPTRDAVPPAAPAPAPAPAPAATTSAAPTAAPSPPSPAIQPPATPDAGLPPLKGGTGGATP